MFCLLDPYGGEGEEGSVPESSSEYPGQKTIYVFYVQHNKSRSEERLLLFLFALRIVPWFIFRYLLGLVRFGLVCAVAYVISEVSDVRPRVLGEMVNEA